MAPPYTEEGEDFTYMGTILFKHVKITIGNLRKILRESLNEVESLSFDALYHGTSQKAAEKIRKSGFSTKNLGSKSGAPMPGISTTIEREVAEEHSQWAAEKNDDDPEVLVIDARGLKIAPGSLYHSRWNELGSSARALENIKDSGEWDGAALFDTETGNGIEEWEVLLFQPPPVNRIR